MAPGSVGLNVRVGVYRFLNVGVSKETLHDPDIHLCVNPSGGKSVAQAVRGKAADTGLVTDSIEGAAHIDRVLRSAQFSAEYKVIVLIGSPGNPLILFLLLENICQQLNCRLVERDGSLAGRGLGRTKIYPAGYPGLSP